MLSKSVLMVLVVVAVISGCSAPVVRTPAEIALLQMPVAQDSTIVFVINRTPQTFGIVLDQRHLAGTVQPKTYLRLAVAPGDHTLAVGGEWGRGYQIRSSEDTPARFEGGQVRYYRIDPKSRPRFGDLFREAAMLHPMTDGEWEKDLAKVRPCRSSPDPEFTDKEEQLSSGGTLLCIVAPRARVDFDPIRLDANEIGRITRKCQYLVREITPGKHVVTQGHVPLNVEAKAGTVTYVWAYEDRQVGGTGLRSVGSGQGRMMLAACKKVPE